MNEQKNDKYDDVSVAKYLLQDKEWFSRCLDDDIINQLVT